MNSKQEAELVANSQRMTALLEQMNERLGRIERGEVPDDLANSVEYTTTIDGQEIRGDAMKDLELGQRAKVRIKRFVTAKGKDAKVDGLPSFKMVDESMGKLSVDEDMMGFSIADAGIEGIAQVEMSVDVDRGPGFKEFKKLYEYNFAAGEAVAVEEEEIVEDAE